jgi:hypothetical protein
MKYSCGGGCHAFNIRFNKNINMPYKPYCELMKYRFKLSCWILARIIENGEIKKLKRHLQIR